MADKYKSTILVQDNNVTEIKKADLDLLKKINEVSAETTDKFSVVENMVWVKDRSYPTNVIVYNPTDGLTYISIKASERIQPNYTSSTANTYWQWIAGSAGGYVSGRGWWTKFADGTLIQRSIPIPNPAFDVRTYLHQIAQVNMSWTLPISFNDTNYDAVGSFAYSSSSGLSGYWGVYENSKTTAIVVGRATSPSNYAANTMYLRIIAIGRWKE